MNNTPSFFDKNPMAITALCAATAWFIAPLWAQLVINFLSDPQTQTEISESLSHFPDFGSFAQTWVYSFAVLGGVMGFILPSFYLTLHSRITKQDALPLTLTKRLVRQTLSVFFYLHYLVFAYFPFCTFASLVVSTDRGLVLRNALLMSLLMTSFTALLALFYWIRKNHPLHMTVFGVWFAFVCGWLWFSVQQLFF